MLFRTDSLLRLSIFLSPIYMLPLFTLYNFANKSKIVVFPAPFSPTRTETVFFLNLALKFLITYSLFDLY